MTRERRRGTGITPRRHLAWVIVLVAVSAWVYVDTWQSNSGIFDRLFLGHFLGWTAAFAVGGAVLASPAALRWSANGFYAAAVVGSLVLQSWAVFGRLHGAIARTSNDLVAWSTVGFAVLGLLVLAYRSAAHPAALSVAAVLAAFLVGWPLIQAIDAVLNPAIATVKTKAAPAAIEAGNGPDVYVVVLDGYGSRSVFEELELAPGTIHSELSRRGFEVLDEARSNFISTSFSLAAVLEGRTPRPADGVDIEPELRAIYAGDNAAVREFSRLGYETHIFHPGWTRARCAVTVDVCHESWWNELDDTVLRRTPLPAIWPPSGVSAWSWTSKARLTEAAQLAGTRSDRPRFVIVHALIPHAPFHLDENCDARPRPWLDGYRAFAEDPATLSARLHAYAEQARCTDALVLELVDAAPADSLFLITGDHGPRLATQGDLADPEAPTTIFGLAFSTLTSARVAGCDNPPANATVTLAARTVYECAGASLEGDTDGQFVYDFDRLTMTEVTDRLTPAGGESSATPTQSCFCWRAYPYRG